MTGSDAVARTAIFGGTFDPVHNTHLRIARAAADAFSRLKQALFVPAGNPPFKPPSRHVAQASWRDRMAMLELAVSDTGDARFEVSDIERPSPAGEPSYSILTVEALLASGRGPLSLILGADAFADIGKWRRSGDLIRMVEFMSDSARG